MTSSCLFMVLILTTAAATSEKDTHPLATEVRALWASEMEVDDYDRVLTALRRLARLSWAEVGDDFDRLFIDPDTRLGDIATDAQTRATLARAFEGARSESHAAREFTLRLYEQIKAEPRDSKQFVEAFTFLLETFPDIGEWIPDVNPMLRDFMRGNAPLAPAAFKHYAIIDSKDDLEFIAELESLEFARIRPIIYLRMSEHEVAAEILLRIYEELPEHHVGQNIGLLTWMRREVVRSLTGNPDVDPFTNYRHIKYDRIRPMGVRKWSLETLVEIEKRLMQYLHDQRRLVDEGDDETTSTVKKALREELEAGIERLRKIIEERSDDDGG